MGEDMADRTRLAGYKRFPGAARQYVTPDGEVISYRAYRNRLSAAELIQALDPVRLANARHARRQFQNIVNTIFNQRKEELEARIEYAKEIGDDEEAEALQDELRTLKSDIIKSPERKNALKQLTANAHKKDPASMQATKDALVALGRRGGIPDWVPPGLSDKFRHGTLRRGRIPKEFAAYKQTPAYMATARPRRSGGMNTRGSKG